MKKIIISLIVFFVVIFGLGWLFFTSAPFLLSRVLSSKLKVDVEVSRIMFHPQGVTVYDFKMKNPPRSPLPDAFTAKSIRINLKWASLLKNPVDIDSVLIDDVYVSILLPKKKKIACNWIKIFEGLAKDKSFFQRTEREFTINYMRVSNLTVELYTPNKKAEKVGPIKKIEVGNIHSESGVPLRAFTRAVVSAMIKKIYSLQAVQKAISGLLLLPFEIFQFIFTPSGDNPCGDYYDVDVPEKPLPPEPGGFPSGGHGGKPGEGQKEASNE